MARVLFIIAQNNFRDEELTIPLDELRTAGHIYKIASIKKGKCIGMFGLEVQSDLAIDDINPEDFDAFILVGGSGSPELASNSKLLSLLKSAHSSNKLIAAICLAPVILAKAKILHKVKATVYLSQESIEALKQNNAIIVKEPVVIDKNIITAEGPKASKEFAKKILILLSSNSQQ